MRNGIYSILIAVVGFGLVFGLASCDEDVTETSSLYIKFTNEASSSHTITAIEVRSMGQSGSGGQRDVGAWGANILTGGLELAPGDSTYFTLPIPNLHWSQYRLGVKQADGTTLMLHEQAPPVLDELPITHWGSHERTVSVITRQDVNTGHISIAGWSEWAGIDD